MRFWNIKILNSYFLNSKEEFFETLSKEIDKKISTEKGEVKILTKSIYLYQIIIILIKSWKHEKIFLTEGDKKNEEIGTTQINTENQLALRSDLSLKTFLKNVRFFHELSLDLLFRLWNNFLE